MFLDAEYVYNTPFTTVTWMGPPVEALREKFTAHSANGVRLEGDSRDDVGWLPSLPGLRHVTSMSPLKDDSPVWNVSSLTSAVLANKSQAPARIDGTPELVFLQLDYRAGLESMKEQDKLRVLHVWGAKDLAWLQAGPALRTLKVDGTRRARELSLTQVDLAQVTAFVLERCTLTGATGLATAKDLEGVDFSSVNLSRSAAEEVLSILGDLTSLRQINLWRCEGLSAEQVSHAVSDKCTVSEKS